MNICDERQFPQPDIFFGHYERMEIKLTPYAITAQRQLIDLCGLWVSEFELLRCKHLFAFIGAKYAEERILRYEVPMNVTIETIKGVKK